MKDDILKTPGRNVDRRSFLKAVGVLGAGIVAGGALQSTYRVLKLDRRREQVERTLVRMGSFVTITAVHESRDQAQAAIEAAVTEMDRLIGILSRHDAPSPLAVLNRTGELRDVPPELAAVLRASLDMNRTSRGAFDVTVQPVLDLYEPRDGSGMPGDDEVRKALSHVGSRHVILTGDGVRLDDPDVRVTLDGIAPGFIVDRMSDVLVQNGVENHLINVSGDIRVHGRRADGKMWRVAVEDPEKKGHYPDVIQLGSGAVSTSGSYEIYFDREKIHHHIVDPATGQSPLLATSVSVIAPTSMRADALSTAVFVFAPERGCEWIDTLAGAECLVIGQHRDEYRSHGWTSYTTAV